LVLCLLSLNHIISRTEHGYEKIYIYSESLAQDLSESEKKSKIGVSFDEIQPFKKDCQHFWHTRYLEILENGKISGFFPDSGRNRIPVVNFPESLKSEKGLKKRLNANKCDQDRSLEICRFSALFLPFRSISG
jgi:hypothetical protein